MHAYCTTVFLCCCHLPLMAIVVSTLPPFSSPCQQRRRVVSCVPVQTCFPQLCTPVLLRNWVHLCVSLSIYVSPSYVFLCKVCVSIICIFLVLTPYCEVNILIYIFSLFRSVVFYPTRYFWFTWHLLKNIFGRHLELFVCVGGGMQKCWLLELSTQTLHIFTAHTVPSHIY